MTISFLFANSNEWIRKIKHFNNQNIPSCVGHFTNSTRQMPTCCLVKRRFVVIEIQNLNLWGSSRFISKRICHLKLRERNRKFLQQGGGNMLETKRIFCWWIDNKERTWSLDVPHLTLQMSDSTNNRYSSSL